MNPKISDELDPQSTGLFELTTASLLFAPIVFFLTSYLFGGSAGIFFSLLLPISLLVVMYRCSANEQTFTRIFSRLELETAGFFVAVFIYFLWACLKWPDFLAMGERLRDYALLASVMDSPIVAKEPWLVGENLNYYLYWYRFGAYWASIFGVSVWNTYHLLAAFSFALFASTLFRLMRCHLNLSLGFSVLIAVLIPLGSNLSGILSAFSGSTDWWGPSRVIKGAINEFPAWSFLLGDLHPHFLNLTLTPLLLCFAFAITKLNFNWSLQLSLILFLFLLGGALHYNCNAWEVPMAGITFGFSLILALAAFGSNFSDKISSFPRLLFTGLANPRALALIATIGLSLISLIISSSHLQPADYPWHLVKSPIPDTTLSELSLHWGVPLFVILIALLRRLSSYNSIAAATLFAIGLATQNTTLILVALTTWVCVEALIEIDMNEGAAEKLKSVLLYSLGIGSLSLLVLGEIIFLDDPYGGENERMNTIFKIYSASWAPLHLFAFCLIYRDLLASRLSHLTITGSIILIATMPAFFLRTIELRKNSSPSMEGLASVEQQFAGSADAIRYLRSQPRKTMLEAQGNPYSYTTHVATLGNQNSYLGWANHVGLLTGKHSEVSRREQMSEQIYKAQTCETKKVLAQKEKIELITIGALEKQKYGDSIGLGFSCFNKVYENSGYSVFSVN